MASISRSATSILVMITVLLPVNFCEGRPEPPDFISFFTSPTSIRVEWQEPSLDPGTTVKGFRLQYKLGDGGKLIKLKLKALNSHDIEGLPEACGDYRIRMSTASSNSLSRYSSFSQVDRVPAAPESLAAVPTISSSARINWDRPPNSFCITGYRLTYGPDQSDMRTMELPELLNQYLLSDLQPNISYMLSLEAVADDNRGEEAFSQWFQAAVPGLPTNLRADLSSPEAVVVMWSAAASAEHYKYKYGTVETPDSKMTEGFVRSDRTILEGLEPGQEYRFIVSSVNSVGRSEEVTVTWTQPSPAPVVPQRPKLAAPDWVRVEITSSETAMISWSPPVVEDRKLDVTGYIVGYGLQGGPDQDMFSLPPEELQSELDGLKPGSAYIANVQAYNDVEDGEVRSVEWVQEAQITIPTEVQGVLTYSSSPTSITVRWLLTEDVVTEQTEGFRVTYGQLQSADDFERVLGADADSVELAGLQPETFYYIKVYKFNAAGRSPAVLRSLETPADVQSNNRCAQQQRCTQQFQGDGAVCPRILQYLNCLQTLRDFCMEDASYRHSVANVRQMFLTEGCNRNPQTTQPVDQEPPVPEEECPGQQQCRLKFSSQPQGEGEICVRILQYLHCLQWLQDLCMKEAGYRSHVAVVREMFMTEGCHGNPERTHTGGRDPPVPEIPAPTNLEATVLSPTSARLTWVDETLIDGQAADSRFYIVRYRSDEDPVNAKLIEVRTQETSFLADFLVPRVEFEFSVQLVLGPQRRSEPTVSIRVTSRDPAQGAAPQRLTVLQVIITSPLATKAVFKWLPPPERNDIREYLFEYTDSEDFQDPETIQQKVIMDGSQMETVIEGLTPNTEYRARIRAIFTANEQGPFSIPPALFTTPVTPPSSKATEQCGETDVETVTRQIGFLWGDVAQRAPLFGVPIPYCGDIYSTEECHGRFCFCIPGKKPPALRNPECNSNVAPCQREYEAARLALVEGRENGNPAIAAQLPHCRPDGYYQPKQCSGTMCYCVTENGDFTGQEAPIWEASRLNCA